MKYKERKTGLDLRVREVKELRSLETVQSANIVILRILPWLHVHVLYYYVLTVTVKNLSCI